jgi:predicted transcriptional regulator
MEHDRKTDTKLFHAFGRYEGSTAQGWVLRYDSGRRDYVAVGQDEEADLEQMVGQREGARVQAKVVGVLQRTGRATEKEVAAKISDVSKAKVLAAIEALLSTGIIRKVEVKGLAGKPKQVLEVGELDDEIRPEEE